MTAPDSALQPEAVESPLGNGLPRRVDKRSERGSQGGPGPARRASALSSGSCAALAWNLVACLGALAALAVPATAILYDSSPPVLPPHRFDYRFAFKKPYYLYKDNVTIPYFDYFGDIILAQDYLRLTPSVQLKKGAIWSQETNTYDEWIAEFSFSITGKGYMGGDGFAFWYSKTRQDKAFPVLGNHYGFVETWEGLAVIFDTMDPDEHRYTPYVYGVHNDGKQVFPQGTASYQSRALGGCFRDYRSTYAGPVWVRVSHYNKILKVEVDLRQGGKAFDTCFTMEHTAFPPGYYFGFSASTGNYYADDQDLHSFEVYQVNPPAIEHPSRPKEEELKKEGHEFRMSAKEQAHIHEAEKYAEDRRSKLQSARNPDEAFLSAMTPETVQAFKESQLRIVESLDVLHTKLANMGAGGRPASGAFTPGSPSEGGTTGGIAIEIELQNIRKWVESFNAKLDKLVEEFAVTQRDSAAKLQILEDTVKNMHASTITNMNSLANQLDRTGKQVASTHDTTSRVHTKLLQDAEAGLSWWAYLGILLATQVCLLVVYSWWRRRGGRDDKKFI